MRKFTKKRIFLTTLVGFAGPLLALGSSANAEDYVYKQKFMHRAITSLMEELEAVDWYNQRVDACKDPELEAILSHNRDE